jgi:protein gp37
MSDIFHAQFTVEMIRRVFDVMNRASWHQFQVLTKRPERAARLADKLKWGAHIWLGTSIENMDVARRADALRNTPAYIKFISAEPLLGRLDDLDLTGIDWVIGGGDYRGNVSRVEQAKRVLGLVGELASPQCAHRCLFHLERRVR